MEKLSLLPQFTFHRVSWCCEYLLVRLFNHFFLLLYFCHENILVHDVDVGTWPHDFPRPMGCLQMQLELADSQPFKSAQPKLTEPNEWIHYTPANPFPHLPETSDLYRIQCCCVVLMFQDCLLHCSSRLIYSSVSSLIYNSANMGLCLACTN